MSLFKKATKEQSKLRLCLSGGSGAGKTRSALEIAKHLGNRVVLIDTETGSASKYSDKVDFDVAEITGDYHPQRFMDMLAAAAAEGYDVCIIDSLTHAWNGPGGCLDLVDAKGKQMQARGGKADNFAAYKEITPLYQKLVSSILQSPMHVIVCLRAKQEYSREGGKVTKLGVAPEMRDQFQFEMDIEGLIDQEHNLHIGKTRCDLVDGKMFPKPGKEFAELLKSWLNSGAPASPKVVAPVVTAPEEPKPIPQSSVFSELQARFDAVTSLADVEATKADAMLASTEKRITAEEFSKLAASYKAAKAKVTA